MAKHRKTRQEKLVADQRHISYHLDTTPAQVSLPSEKKTQFQLDFPTSKTHAISYSYVLGDIKKTSFITLSIILTQIILFIILNRI